MNEDRNYRPPKEPQRSTAILIGVVVAAAITAFVVAFVEHLTRW